MSLRSLSRSLLLCTASATLVACQSSTGPRYAEFDPTRAQANLDAMMTVFASPAVEQFVAASWHVNVGGAHSLAAVAGARRLLASRSRPVAAVQRAHVAAIREVLSGERDGAAMAVLPDEIRGTTYVFDAGEGGYVPSDRPGAPANGVRFILYSVEGGTLTTTEVGYIEIVDLAPTGDNSIAVRLRVVNGGTTYLDYTLGVTSSETSLSLEVDGHVTDGSTLVSFGTQLQIAEGPNGFSGSIGFSFHVPSRSFSMEGTIVEGYDGSETEIIISTNRAEVRYYFPGGDYASGEIYVNGALFAQVTETEDGYAVVGANGRTLTMQERVVLENLLDGSETVFFWWIILLLPVGGFVPL